MFGFAAIAGALLTPTIGKIADKGYIFTMTNVSMALVLLSIVLLFFVQDHSLFSVIVILISGISIDIGVAGNLLLGQKVIFSLNPEIRNRLNGLYMTIFFWEEPLVHVLEVIRTINLIAKYRYSLERLYL